MSEARRLLERLTAEEAMSYPVDHGNPPDLPTVGNELHCDYCDANVDHDGPHETDCPWAEARAYLAQPVMGLTEEERKLLEWHSPRAGWWRREKRYDICRGCNLGLIEDCVTRATILALAESREREGELVAALEKAKALAERHWRALQKWRMGGGHLHGAIVDTDKCPACLEFAAAIEEEETEQPTASPEEMEKARRFQAEQKVWEQLDHARFGGED